LDLHHNQIVHEGFTHVAKIRHSSTIKDAVLGPFSLGTQICQEEAMTEELRQQIYTRLSQKETAELVEMWQTNDRATWTEMAFDVIREILQERLVELPPQGKPVSETHKSKETTAKWMTPWMGWGLVAFSFVLVLLLHAGAIVLADQAAYRGQLAEPYLVICLPVSVVILAIGAGVGANMARARGKQSWAGAILGIWIGAIASMFLSVWALLDIGPGQ